MSILFNLKDLNCPRIAILLGYGGLLPFILSVILILLDIDFIIDPFKILLYYGSVILSFVGAISWGFATKELVEKNNSQEYLFLWSVFPSIVAFFALMNNQQVGFFLLIFGFILAYLADRKIEKIVSIPSWYLFLRLQLTLVVTSCLIVGLLANLLQVA